MDFTYFEAVMAFFGLASIVIGSFAPMTNPIWTEDDRSRDSAAWRPSASEIYRILLEEARIPALSARTLSGYRSIIATPLCGMLPRAD